MKSIVPSSFTLLVALLAVLAVANNVLRTEARQFEGAEMSWDMKSASEPDPDHATPRIRPLSINPPKTSWDHLHDKQHIDVGKPEISSIESDVLDRAKPQIKTLPYPPKGEQIQAGQHNDLDKAESSIERTKAV